MAVIRRIKESPCYPVTLEQLRRHLSLDATTTVWDDMMNMAISAAARHSEEFTGRTWCEEVWEWKPKSSISSGTPINFPLVPVTSVKIYDANEQIQIGGDYTDISETVAEIDLPSLERPGQPVAGSLLPVTSFPANYKIVLTVGYPIEEIQKTIEEKSPPTLVHGDTKYTDTKIHLTFNREIFGSANPKNFTIYKYALENNEEIETEIIPQNIGIEQGGVSIVFEQGDFEAGDKIKISFVEGFIHDIFNNFVMPIFETVLPIVNIEQETDFVVPQPLSTESIWVSHAPEQIKQYILTWAAGWFRQRTPIALRAGKSNDALFKHEFVDKILDAFRTFYV